MLYFLTSSLENYNLAHLYWHHENRTSLFFKRKKKEIQYVIFVNITLLIPIENDTEIFLLSTRIHYTLMEKTRRLLDSLFLNLQPGMALEFPGPVSHNISFVYIIYSHKYYIFFRYYLIQIIVNILINVLIKQLDKILL